MADDLGYGDLSCYGQKKFTTPNIDKLAKEGLRFTQYYSGSTVCAPSRCALMTGFHMGHAYIRGNKGGKDAGLRPEDTTIAEVLKNSGYATGMFGKWGLGGVDSTGAPEKKGFDEFFGYLSQVHAHEYYTDYLYRNSEKIHYDKPPYRHDVIFENALNFVRKHKAQPFFLYLPVTIPHAGLQVPEDSLQEFRGKFPETPWGKGGSGYARQEKPHAAFAAMITRLDRDVGRLSSLLKELGIDDNTVIFFTSDNGPHHEGGGDPEFFNSSGGLRGIKRDLYEGGIRMPMIVRWPGKIKAGKTTDHIAAHWDFPATACDIAGIPLRKSNDGISMLPTLLGKRQKQHDYMYWEFFEGGFKQAVRLDDWKAVKSGGRLELFNLKNDLSEKNDVALKNPKIVATMEQILKEARTDSAIWKTTSR